MNELTEFVKAALTAGRSRAEIERVLSEAGWRKEETDKALSAFADVSFSVPVPRPRPYLRAKEAFLYLVSFIALYIAAFSFGSLVFSFVDILVPDPLAFSGYRPSLNVPLASLIVSFPLYLFLARHLARSEETRPERRQSRVRTWLTYLTLVVAASVIIGDAIALLSSLLGGDTTLRFALKALVILAVAGSVFGWYLSDLRKEEAEDDAQ